MWLSILSKLGCDEFEHGRRSCGNQRGMVKCFSPAGSVTMLLSILSSWGVMSLNVVADSDE